MSSIGSLRLSTAAAPRGDCVSRWRRIALVNVVASASSEAKPPAAPMIPPTIFGRSLTCMSWPNTPHSSPASMSASNPGTIDPYRITQQTPEPEADDVGHPLAQPALLVTEAHAQ